MIIKNGKVMPYDGEMPKKKDDVPWHHQIYKDEYGEDEDMKDEKV